jgi:predicted AAA+ superfamily ATPase
MPITELPTERSKIVSYNPSLIVLYGVPKCGKSTLMAHLDDNLILDFEDGYRALSVMKVQVRTAQDLFQVKKLLANKMSSLGKVPYKFITMDNATRLEEVCLPYAAYLLNNSSFMQ